MNTHLLRRSFLTAFTAALLLLLLPSLSHAATRKVPSQYSNIQAAINAAVSGDTVLVADGKYTGDGNRDLDFFGKSLTVKSENGPAKTVIDAQGTSDDPHRGFYIRRYELVVVIDGFTVRNGYSNYDIARAGGGAYIVSASATVTNCTFSGNAGGGGADINSGNTVAVTNCTFSGNTAKNSGGGAYFFNIATTNGAGTTVTNCIAWGDTAPIGKEFYFDTNDALSLTFSDIQGGAASVFTSNQVFMPTGDINADPKFVSAATGDLHLQAGSPCFGRGTHTGAPATDKDGKTRPNPPSMGAYDIVYAVKTLTLLPTSVYGGQTSTGTVTLDKPAPTGGIKVVLGSNTGYAVVAPSVTIPAGLTSKTFTVTSNPVAAAKAATILATSGGITKTANLLIYPPALASLTLNPTTVKGGKLNSAATVTLTSAAPYGGTVVSVGSNTGYAVVPRSVTVPAGGKVVVFTVVSKPVSANKGATITATLASVSKSAGLLLTP